MVCNHEIDHELARIGGAVAIFAYALERLVGFFEQTEQTIAIEFFRHDRHFVARIVEQIDIAGCEQIEQKVRAGGGFIRFAPRNLGLQAGE